MFKFRKEWSEYQATLALLRKSYKKDNPLLQVVCRNARKVYLQALARRVATDRASLAH